MQKYVQLHDRLAECYAKIPYKQYFFSSEDTQEATCKREREDLSEHINSDEMNFDNILKERLAFLENNEKKVTDKGYKIPEKVDISHYMML